MKLTLATKSTRLAKPVVVALVVMLTSESSMWAVVHDVPFLRGDANNDGSVDVFDDTVIFEWLNLGGEDRSCLAASDMNDDGAVDNSDVLCMLQWIFMGGVAPPAPFPACAVDPTPDNLGCVESFCATE